jgi:hypothetical protein
VAEKDPTTSEVEEKQLPEGAADESTKGAGGEVETTPPPPEPRTYSEAEWDKRQASWDADLAKKEKAYKDELEAERKKREEAADALEQKHAEEFIAKVESQGGDVPAARALMAKQAAIREQERENLRLRQELEAERATLSPIRKRQDAEELARQYEVDVDPLLEAENKVEMELLASKLALEKAKIAAKPPAKTDSDVSTTKGLDLSKLSSDEKIKSGLGDMEI